jgi:FKBP-type peptidyl-prolyl cis-trans isomerase
LGKWEGAIESITGSDGACHLSISSVGESWVVESERQVIGNCEAYVGVYTLTPQGNLLKDGGLVLAFDKQNARVIVSGMGKLRYLVRAKPPQEQEEISRDPRSMALAASDDFVKARVQAAAQKQKDLSKPYLENAAREKGAEKTASGLIYQQIKAGVGAQPKASDIVKIHYTGKLISGKEIDSSIKRGQPAEFPLGQVIPCWTEGVGKMKVGGKAKLVCPSDIGYGDQGRPPIIPGGATLIFEVELLDVKAVKTRDSAQ